MSSLGSVEPAPATTSQPSGGAYPIVIFLAAVAFSIWAYPHLPDRVPTHWGIDGRVNGWGSRTFGVCLLPAIMLGFVGLFRVLPRIDPKRENYLKFRGVYNLLASAVLVMMLGIHIATIGAGLGWAVPVSGVISALMGLEFIVLGIALPRTQPNWFVGIRTPWTLASETVWKKTHRVGGLAFLIAGIVIFGTAWLPPRTSVVILLVAAGCAALVPVILSYVWWAQERRASA